MCKWTILDKIITKIMAIDLHNKLQKVEELMAKLEQQLIESWHLQAFHYQPRGIKHECESWKGFHYRKVEYFIRADQGAKSPHGFSTKIDCILTMNFYKRKFFSNQSSCLWKRKQGKKEGKVFEEFWINIKTKVEVFIWEGFKAYYHNE
jgi:hypothetical protein